MPWAGRRGQGRYRVNRCLVCWTQFDNRWKCCNEHLVATLKNRVYSLLFCIPTILDTLPVVFLMFMEGMEAWLHPHNILFHHKEGRLAMGLGWSLGRNRGCSIPIP